ncbi:DUF3798 domain-containing protein [Jonquetella sp. BV3C21]|uniref:DUF3798 domain-containing protein n=1 Tax=Jonquetella sp. BV3C21 TaxID=1111126 RepID=UPI0003AE3E4A|nr:DUF3798 domain-containing protein [Jonquetella sp. BV3C21]ERL23649.1 PF12683 family protein [Jonquetella sp. BV3C21]
MRRCLALLALAGLSVWGTGAFAAQEAAYHIGICTGTVSQSEDSLRGAEELIKRYGDAASGGMIKHITYPDNFMSEQETTISQIAAFADDPKMKAVIVNNAIPGTTEAYRRIREKRPDILLLAGEAHEDPSVISSAADLTVSEDFLSLGYVFIAGLHKLGATDFVHVSFPRHMSMELLLRRLEIMKKACADMGMKFHMESSPDPTSDVGVAGSQQFILEKVPAWLAQYGPKTAFFSTSDGQRAPMILRVAEVGGYTIGADLMAYASGLGIDLKEQAGDFAAMRSKIEKDVVAKGASGRLCADAWSYNFVHSVALGELAKKLVDAGVTPQNFRRRFEAKEVFDAFSAETPGSRWLGDFYRDANTGIKLNNFMLIYQDIYTFGVGFLGMTDKPVPAKYFEDK